MKVIHGLQVRDPVLHLVRRFSTEIDATTHATADSIAMEQNSHCARNTPLADVVAALRMSVRNEARDLSSASPAC